MNAITQQPTTDHEIISRLRDAIQLHPRDRWTELGALVEPTVEVPIYSRREVALVLSECREKWVCFGEISIRCRYVTFADWIANADCHTVAVYDVEELR